MGFAIICLFLSYSICVLQRPEYGLLMPSLNGTHLSCINCPAANCSSVESPTLAGVWFCPAQCGLSSKELLAENPIVLGMEKRVEIWRAEDAFILWSGDNEKFSINSISKGHPDEGDAPFCVTSSSVLLSLWCWWKNASVLLMGAPYGTRFREPNVSFRERLPFHIVIESTSVSFQKHKASWKKMQNVLKWSVDRSGIMTHFPWFLSRVTEGFPAIRSAIKTQRRQKESLLLIHNLPLKG